MQHLEKLKEPFSENEVEFRLAQCGENNGKIWAQCLAYISARAIQDRLDQVCGPENWTVAYEFVGSTGVICNLSIKCGDEWVRKQDGADFTDIESFKGGISSALKRAGSAWGMGRYLYALESGFARIVEKGSQNAQYGKTKSGTSFYWAPPQLPTWALPKKETGESQGTTTLITPKKSEWKFTPDKIEVLKLLKEQAGWDAERFKEELRRLKIQVFMGMDQSQYDSLYHVLKSSADANQQMEQENS